jgi:V/A-type H+-transporting ATPase subunit F
MHAFLVSDNIDSLVGMKLAGINGVIVHDGDSALDEINKISEDKNAGIVLITEKAAEMAGERLSKLKIKKGMPLIVEIPDRHSTGEEKDRITKYIKEAIGLKV